MPDNVAPFPITAGNLQGLIRLLKNDSVPLKPLDITEMVWLIWTV